MADDQTVDQKPEEYKRRRAGLKPKSRETRFKKLRSLHCFPEVHQRTREGHSTVEIARFIQKERGEYTEISEKGLASLLRQYRGSVPPAELLSTRPIPAVKNALVKLNEGVDEVEELERLYHLQRKRIDIDYKLEKKVGKLLAGTNYEVRLAKDILKDSAAIKMDLGINQRHLGQLDIEANLVAEVGRYGNDAVTKVVSSPESRQKVLAVAQKFMQLAAKLESSPSELADVIDAEVTSVSSPDSEPK